MESFGDAITEAGKGVIIALEVSPSSGREGFFAGYDPWRKSIRCSARSPPVQGRANREVIGSVAEALGVPAASVEVISGSTRSRKRVRVTGITKPVALERFARYF